jgi:hypothetical protein
LIKFGLEPTVLPHKRGDVETTQLAVEFGSGRRIAVGQVEATDENAVNRGFDIAAACIIRIGRKITARLDGLDSSCENRHAIPGFLAMPNRPIPSFGNLPMRELFIGRFQLLPTNNVRRRDPTTVVATLSIDHEHDFSHRMPLLHGAQGIRCGSERIRFLNTWLDLSRTHKSAI